MKYCIVTDTNEERFQDKVRALLKQGWLLYGNLVVTQLVGFTVKGTKRAIVRYTQAFID